MSDLAILLLILEGLPLMGFVYYLSHKRRMYLLERGIEERDDPMLRAERRLINGTFLTLAGLLMALTPQIGSMLGIEAQLTLEILLVSSVVFCAGLALLIGSGLLRYRSARSCEGLGLTELK
ncbi:MAG: hypothetical protein QUS08_03045 [Methanothrix sp.]|nr:hypothetical protein [Methanothrix sp.]